MANKVPADWSSLFRGVVWRLSHDPLIEVALAYMVCSVFLRVGQAVLPSAWDAPISDASGGVTLILVLTGGYVLARRMLL